MVQPRQRWCSKIQVTQTASAGLAYDFFRFLRRPLLASSSCEKIYQETASGGRRSKLTTAQQQQIIEMVSSGQKSAAYAAKLFRMHPSTVTRLMAGSGRISAYNDH